MGELDALFTPVRIGSLTLRNRLVMSPMETGMATREGLPSERQLAYLEARARGGVGLITLGASSVDERHREVPRSLHFGSDAVVAAHRALTERVHAHGARVQPQLVHPGPDGLAPQLHGIPSLGPSVIPSLLTGTPCRELAADELPGIVDQFRAAARRVHDAGYDGLELHAAHGYMLLGSFLTPWRNRRSDAYGAVTPEGRIRLLVEVVQAIKAELGPAFPLTLRISGFERVAGGRPLADTQRLAPALVRAGVDAFHVSGGVIDRLTTQMVAGSQTPAGHNVAAAEAVKRVVAVPVIAVGRIHEPRLAARIVREGRADLVAMGRPLLADPLLPRKAREGRLAQLRRCISCQHCIDSMERGRMGCAVDARTGREAELAVRPAARTRHVVVVGGGPAGLELARLAAARGHRVSLYEREARLGGALRAAAIVHAENQPFLDFLCAEVARLGVRVHLGSEMSVPTLLALAPDVVVVATGGRVVTPKLAGDELPHVVSGAGLRALLAGRIAEGQGAARQRLAARLLAGGRLADPRWLRGLSRAWLPLGRRVAIVGGDLAAVELAEFLAERRRRVALLAPGDELAPEVGPKRRGEHMERLDRLGVVVSSGAQATRVVPQGVRIRSSADGEVSVPADTVVLAGQVEADPSLYAALRERVPEAHAIGDCTGLGLLAGATEDAARVACAL